MHSEASRTQLLLSKHYTLLPMPRHWHIPTPVHDVYTQATFGCLTYQKACSIKLSACCCATAF